MMMKDPDFVLGQKESEPFNPKSTVAATTPHN